ncbi:MAG: MmgE/PrpD family protein [Betaproteobacteria bacterium]|nr:MmgE/PrpD family protein [Betaproteobacteria bacterium]
MDSMIERLAEYAAGLRYRDLPPEVVHECKRKLIDTLGCLAGGFGAGPSVAARAVARRSRGRPAARILGSQERTSPELAAFANGVALRYLDYNDAYFMKSSGHPSDTFAAVLAAADAAGAGGRSVITAAALAYEGYVNLSDAVAREQGWDHSVYCVIGSALGAGKILGLSREAMGNAVSLAIIPNMALEQTRTGELAMWKGCAGPNAARNGVFAAQLAREGLTGPERAIEGKWGLWHALGKFEWRPFGGRGGPYRLTRTHIKNYPVVVHAQTPVTVALQLHGAVAPQDIEAVAIGTYWVANRYVDRRNALWRPATRETADHSIPYCVAAALADGRITGKSFSAARIRDPLLARLIERTTISERPEFSRRYPHEWPCRIEIAARGGVKKSAQARYFKGHAEDPLTDAEIEAKFRALAAKTMTPAQMDKVLAAAWRLEQLAGIGELLGLLRFRAR